MAQHGGSRPVTLRAVLIWKWFQNRRCSSRGLDSQAALGGTTHQGAGGKRGQGWKQQPMPHGGWEAPVFDALYWLLWAPFPSSGFSRHGVPNSE